MSQSRSPSEHVDAEIGGELRDRAAGLIARGGRVVAFSGAGISTESGIPDYRGPNGVWATQDIPHIDKVRTNRETRLRMWQDRRSRYPEMFARKPNAGHIALAELERRSLLLAIITQNIDGLHQKAGNNPERVIELHGTTHQLRCVDCGREYDAAGVQARLEAGEEDPRCPVCGGVLRSATVLFGEALPEKALRTAAAAAKVADVMLVVGSSLVVNPASRLPMIAKHAGAELILINRTPTPLDGDADVLIRGEAGPELSAIIRRVDGLLDAEANDD